MLRRTQLVVVAALVASCAGEDRRSPPCTAAAVLACSCPGGVAGSAVCSADGVPGACACPGPCDGGSLLAAGSAPVLADATSVSFAGAPVQVLALHKRDVDLSEAGCVPRLSVVVGDPEGCILQLEFAPNGWGGGVGLGSVRFTAGSLCPGFPDAVEGDYVRYGPALEWFTGLDTVLGGGAAQVCLPEVSLSFASIAPIRLERQSDGRPLVLDLSPLTLTGALETSGDTSFDLACPADLRCPELTHDGGDRWCVPLDACSPAFHDGGAGACLPEGTCASGLGLAPDGSCAQWAPTPTLVTPRAYPAAATLADGSVLVAGGWSPTSTSPATAAAERFVPSAHAFAATGSMLTPRADFTLTALPGGGALAAGGFGPTGESAYSTGALASAEIYVESTGQWVGAGSSLSAPRLYHAAVRLASGRVMVLGGQDASFTALASTEIYDQVAGTWTPGPELPAPMPYPAAIALPDGRVLAVSYGRAATYDPGAGAWAEVPNFPYYFQAALAPLPGARVLIASGDYAPLIYDLASGIWHPAAATGPTGRITATEVPGGRVLLVGDGEAIYDPGADAFTPAPAPTPGRNGHAAAALPDGRVLVVGGYEPFNATADVFIGRY